MKKLVIDALIFKDKKSYGYQEYLFGLLDYFYQERTKILFDKIIISCEINQKPFFNKYTNKIEVEGFKANNRIELFIAQNQLKQKLQLGLGDVILYTYNYSSFFKQAKYILVVHDLLYLRKKLLPNILMRWQRHLFVPRSLYYADSIIAISNFTKSDILQHYNVINKKIEVIYNYFNFQKFFSINVGSIKHYKKPFYLSVSSIYPHKNVITLFKAFNLVYLAYKNCPDLVLVGRKSSMDVNCENYYKSLSIEIREKIIFAEDISSAELGTLYNTCECFILPTLFEGLGMPIIEALYFSAKLVLSNIAICKEIAGNNAVYFFPKNEFHLSKILFKKKYKILVSNKQQLDKFSAANTSDKYINVINSFHNV